jgi:hypothetical protein
MNKLDGSELIGLADMDEELSSHLIITLALEFE